MDRLSRYIKRAREHGACKRTLAVVRACGSVEKAKQHEDAPYWVFYYSRYVLGHRWRQMEDVIRRDPYWAFAYAHEVIRGRWPEAEDIIREIPHTACLYAFYVIKGRWRKAEKAIHEDPDFGGYYEYYIPEI